MNLIFVRLLFVVVPVLSIPQTIGEDKKNLEAPQKKSNVELYDEVKKLYQGLSDKEGNLQTTIGELEDKLTTAMDNLNRDFNNLRGDFSILRRDMEGLREDAKRQIEISHTKLKQEIQDDLNVKLKMSAANVGGNFTLPSPPPKATPFVFPAPPNRRPQGKGIPRQ